MWIPRFYSADTAERYSELTAQLSFLLDGERDMIANMANMSSLLYHGLENINWAGFYILRGKELVLGPFQGLPACIRIPMGRGVCGTAALQGKTQLVEDVHRFPGHIACDGASQSELVVPLLREGSVIGVLDLDSPIPARFGSLDALNMEKMAQMLLDASRGTEAPKP